MKIAMVSEHASPLAALGGPETGGQNLHVAALGRALARAGHRVTIYTRRDADDLPAEVRLGQRLAVKHVPAGPAKPVVRDELLPYMPAFGAYLADTWSADRPDIVHAHFWMSGLASLLGARDHDLPVVQTFHALGAIKRRYQGAKDTSPEGRIRLEIAIARDADAILATSTAEVFELVRLGVPRRSIRVVPCGVDVDTFTVDGPVAERPGNRPRLLSVGRLVEWKGVDDIIRALHAIPKAELLIAGGPSANRLRSDPEVRRLRAIAEEWGVSRRVKFLGQVPHDELPPLMRSADAVVCVPWYEPFGIVPLEAMACGVPVVAAAVGGLVDTVIDGTTGVLVPPRRPAALAKAIRKLLAEPILRYAYGIAGSDRARSRYSWDRVARESVGAYQRVRAHYAERPAVGEGA